MKIVARSIAINIWTLRFATLISLPFLELNDFWPSILGRLNVIYVNGGLEGQCTVYGAQLLSLTPRVTADTRNFSGMRNAFMEVLKCYLHHKHFGVPPRERAIQ